MPQIYQIAIPALAVIAIMYAFSRYGRKEKTLREVIIWILFWGLMSYIALFPHTIDMLARITGMKDGIKALAMISIAILAIVVLKLVLTVEKLEQDITKVVRSDALKNVSKKDEN